jgi:hypothetical protein
MKERTLPSIMTATTPHRELPPASDGLEKRQHAPTHVQASSRHNAAENIGRASAAGTTTTAAPHAAQGSDDLMSMAQTVPVSRSGTRK